MQQFLGWASVRGEGVMTMEHIFSFKEDKGEAEHRLRPTIRTDPESYKQFIKAMIANSRDYEGSVLATKRNVAQDYYITATCPA